MKKNVFTLIVILAAIYIGLSLVSRDKEYAAEKIYFKAVKLYGKIKANPDVAPPAMVASVKKDLEKIIKHYPGTVLAKQAKLNVAEIEIGEKQYAAAIAILKPLYENPDEKNLDLITKARFFTALAYEKSGDWTSALREYNTLSDKYANTAMGIQAPIYIAEYYKRNNKIKESEEAYAKAVKFYDNLRLANKGNLLGYISSSMLIQAQMSTGDYESAGEEVKKIISDYPTTNTLVQQLPYVELVYVKTLNRPEEAIKIYRQISDSTENKDLKKFMEQKIKAIQKSP